MASVTVTLANWDGTATRVSLCVDDDDDDNCGGGGQMCRCNYQHCDFMDGICHCDPGKRTVLQPE